MKTALGRNDPCPCGSGRKSKRCCGAVADKPAPDKPFALLEKGNGLMKLGLIDSAIWNYREALRLHPAFVPALLNLGAAFIHSGKASEAVETLRHALELNPEAHQAYHGLCACLQTLGDIDGAVEAGRKGLALAPGDAKLHSALIFAMDLSPKFALEDVQAERRRWNAAHAEPLKKTWQPHTNTFDENRTIRIGYVSGDFREHSAMRCALPMLTLFDRDKFSIFAYSNAFVEDETTLKIRRAVSNFVHIDGMSEDQAADLIRKDRIDILVDLSGHSGGNRLLLFARKPAPIQITAWGYATGTGMDAMDVFFADCVTVPEDEKKLYAEKVVWLPSIAPYVPHATFPDVSDAPCAKNGFVTFGSFNRMAKLTDETLAAWGEILKRSPKSKLLFKTHDLMTPDSANLFRDRLTRIGLDTARTEIVGRTTWTDHVAMFNEIDVALDPFPHTGGMTTVESLMMGVPVVTLLGKTIPSRLSASFLAQVGAHGWFPSNWKEYVKHALNISKREDLSELRRSLRRVAMDSILGHPEQYLWIVESEYARLWREWKDKK